MKFDAAVIRMRSDVCVHSWTENDGDYPDAWRAWARCGWRWPWKLTTLTGKSCLLWKIVTRLDPWTLSDVGKSEWIKAETVNCCNIQVWKSHVAYRDPDHTHTHTGLVLLKPPHIHINLKKRSDRENKIYKAERAVGESIHDFVFTKLCICTACSLQRMRVYLTLLHAFRFDSVSDLSFEPLMCNDLHMVKCLWKKQSRAWSAHVNVIWSQSCRLNTAAVTHYTHSGRVSKATAF